MLKDLLEYVTPSMAEARIDNEGKIIRGAVLFGSKESKNGWVYKEKAVQKLQELADGARIFIDHESDHDKHSRQGVRSMESFAGVVHNIKRRGDKILGDWHVSEKYWGLAQDLAKLVPSEVGFSIAVKAYTAKENGREVIEDLHSLSSIDCVSQAATVQSLFEALSTKREVKEKEAGDPKVGTIIQIREADIAIDAGGREPIYVPKKGLTFVPRISQQVALVHEPEERKESKKIVKKEAKLTNEELAKMRAYGIEEEPEDLSEAAVLNSVLAAPYRRDTSERYIDPDLPDEAPVDTELTEANVLASITRDAGIRHGAGESAQIDIYRSPEATWTRRIRELKAPGQQTTQKEEKSEEDQLLSALVRE